MKEEKISFQQNTLQNFNNFKQEIELKRTNSVRVRARNNQNQNSEGSQYKSHSHYYKYKLPQVILEYIVQKAKQNNPTAGADQNLKKSKAGAAINKLGFSKKLKQKYEPKTECQICQCIKPTKDFLSMSGCEHKYCGSCLHQYVIYKINAFESVECPDQSCRKKLDQTCQFYTQLPLDARKKYKKHLQYNMIKDFPNRRMCPSQNCQGWIQIQDNATPTCNKCKKTFCPKCLFEQHQGQCDPHQLTFFQDTLHYRQCSKCKRVIQKTSGCNHITCVCKYQFCYICGKKWSHSHLCNNPQNQPVYVQPIDCCCCEIRCQCCEEDCCACCDTCQCCQCCQDFCNCIGDCCQACCDRVGDCCQACCSCDCECCQSFCNCCCGCQCCQCCQCYFTQCICVCWKKMTAYLIKFLLIIIWITLVLPLYGFVFLFVFLIWIFFTPFAGITVYFIEFICQLKGCCFALAIIFFPISLVIGIGMAYKESFSQFMGDFVTQTLAIPCQMMENICEISFQNN